jgi:hypothetical protein
MPKFVIERQYLVPMYQHVVVEAENLDEACNKAISDEIDWDTQEMDCVTLAQPQSPQPRSRSSFGVDTASIRPRPCEHGSTSPVFGMARR